MNTEKRLAMILVPFLLAAIVLALAFVRCGGQPGPEPSQQVTLTPTGDARTSTHTPTATAIPTRDAPPPTATYDAADWIKTREAQGALIPSATPTELPAVLTAWAEQGTVLPTATPVPPTPTPTQTPTPTPTMTGEEQALVIKYQDANPQTAASVEECAEILKTEIGCNVVYYAKHTTRPELEAVFPGAEFIVIRYERYGGEFVEQHSVLDVVWHDRRYQLPEGFQSLLDRVEVTDENRELVARAFVLLSLPAYLDAEIVFSDWEEGSWPSDWAGPYTYRITVWTRIQGLKMQWYFLFDDEGLLSAKGAVIEHHSGDYVDLSSDSYSDYWPVDVDLEYWRRT